MFTFFCVAVLLQLSQVANARTPDHVAAHGASIGEISITALPVEAKIVLQQIRQGGPFSYAKDGVVFGNYEKILPKQRRGYYHEYTVTTPGVRGRGARRLITGGDPIASDEIYYTDDHYQHFRKVKK